MSRKYSKNIEDFFGGNYEIIYADPPWHYRGRKQFGFAGDVGVDTGGSVMHYKTMKVDEICSVPVKKIYNKNSSLLYLWVPGPILEDGIQVIRAWGYKYKTFAFIWNKLRSNPGYYTLSECEVCLVAKHRKIPQPRGIRNARQYLEEKRTKHSRKPDEIRNRIHRMHPTQNKIELFARVRSAEFDAYGDEI